MLTGINITTINRDIIAKKKKVGSHVSLTGLWCIQNNHSWHLNKKNNNKRNKMPFLHRVRGTWAVAASLTSTVSHDDDAVCGVGGGVPGSHCRPHTVETRRSSLRVVSPTSNSRPRTAARAGAVLGKPKNGSEMPTHAKGGHIRCRMGSYNLRKCTRKTATSVFRTPPCRWRSCPRHSIVCIS